jgi:hypothetical protein
MRAAREAKDDRTRGAKPRPEGAVRACRAKPGPQCLESNGQPKEGARTARRARRRPIAGGRRVDSTRRQTKEADA